MSIALERDGAIVAALTYNPANEELFIAERGKGAFLNDRRLRVAARQRLADAVVACGLPHYGRGDLALARREIAAAQQHFAGLRRYGAATLDLAWIAAGRLDAYWERDLSPWDLAAGGLLVREAGGFVSDSTAATPFSPRPRSSPATTPCTTNCFACSRKPPRSRRSRHDRPLAPRRQRRAITLPQIL